MRFKIDENLPVEAALSLRNAGHDVLTIHDQQMVGDPDPQVAVGRHQANSHESASSDKTENEEPAISTA